MPPSDNPKAPIEAFVAIVSLFPCYGRLLTVLLLPPSCHKRHPFFKYFAKGLQYIVFFSISLLMTNTAELLSDSNGADLPTTPDDLMAHLRALGIAFTLHHHKAVFTVAEAMEVEHDIPGAHCRNLFLRDKKKNNFLVVLRNKTDVDIKKLQGVIGADKLSFGSADRLWEYLGVRPGSVCPYAIINDKDNQVKIILEQGMMEQDIVNYHPLINTMTIGCAPKDLIRFVESTGHVPHILDLNAAKPD